MTKYYYVGNGAYVSGLPARDINDDEMTDDEKAAMKVALKQKLYTTDKPTAKSVKEAEGDKSS